MTNFALLYGRYFNLPQKMLLIIIIKKDVFLLSLIIAYIKGKVWILQ
jgi:hypothetical protein